MSTPVIRGIDFTLHIYEENFPALNLYVLHGARWHI